MTRFYDFAGHEVSLKDTEAKLAWCAHGCNLEQTFVQRYGRQTGTQINPEKATNEYAPDLLWQGERPADLKTQNTPFFTAGRYGIDPQYAVTLNVKDITRYRKKYPDILIFWWVSWDVAAMEQPGMMGRIQVMGMEGVWSANLPELQPLCTDKMIHEYQKRKDDKQGNALASYVLDIRQLSAKVIVQRPQVAAEEMQ